MSTNNVLITGVTGFVGSHLIDYLDRKEDVNQIVSIVRSYRSNKWIKENLKKTQVYILDLESEKAINKLKRIITDYNIKQVFHLAAKVIVSAAQKNPYGTMKANILSTLNVLEACKDFSDIKVLIMSTDKVYGNTLDATENTKHIPTEPYSASKIASEIVAEQYRKFIKNLTIVRCCNIIGYDPYNPSRIVPKTINHFLNGENAIIYDSKSVRQYIYVKDVVKILNNKIGTPEVNITSPHILTSKEIILEIAKQMNVAENRITYKKAPFVEIQQQSMKYTSGQVTPLETAIAEIIECFKTYRR